MGIRKKVEFKNHEPKFPAPLEGYAATVELPDGHHVTIGELTPGTIVEVATWDGTGKPDETTKRFLISADGTGLQRRQVNQSNQIQNQEPPVLTNNQYQAAPISSASGISDPIFGGYGNELSNQSSLSSYQEVQSKDGSSLALKSLKLIGAPVIVIALILGGIKLAGLSVAVPTVGNKSFFGSSTTSLVFYKKNNLPNSGSPVIAKDGSLILFGKYDGNVGNLALFTVNDKKMSVPTQSLQGKGVMLIPFIGPIVQPLIS